MPSAIIFPTLDAECQDTEVRSLQKINMLQARISNALAALEKPGALSVAFTNFVFGVTYVVPTGMDLLDISVYNPNDLDCWVYLIMSPGPAAPGMGPTFLIRAYAHNHAYYECNVAAESVPPGQRFTIAVSATENTLTWNSLPVYLAIRHT